MNGSYIVAYKDNKIYGTYGLDVNKDSFSYLQKDISKIIQKETFSNSVFINNIMMIFHYYLLDNYRPYNKYQIKSLKNIVEESLYECIQNYDTLMSFTNKNFDDAIFLKTNYNLSLLDILDEYNFFTSIEYIKNIIHFIHTYQDYDISLEWLWR